MIDVSVGVDLAATAALLVGGAAILVREHVEVEKLSTRIGNQDRIIEMIVKQGERVEEKLDQVLFALLKAGGEHEDR
jgi:hypothetical protein